MSGASGITSFGGRWLFSWSAWLLAAVMALGLLHWGTKSWGVKPATLAGTEAALRASCDAWDRAASEGIAAIISDTSAAAELRFDEAILQLRRARKNCR